MSADHKDEKQSLDGSRLVDGSSLVDDYVIVEAPSPPAKKKLRVPRKRKNDPDLVEPVSSEPLVKGKRRSYCKYMNYCKGLHIPFPNEKFTRRELDHLEICVVCQQTWPLYLYQQHYEAKIPMDQVVREWLDLPEYERVLKHKTLQQADRAWMHSMVEERTMTGYNLFLKQKRDSCEDLQKITDFAARTKILAKMWNEMGADEKQPYVNEAQKLKDERHALMENLPEFKRKQIQRERRRQLNLQKSQRPPRLANPFMRFLSDQWKKEKAKQAGVPGLQFTDVMQIASRAWKTEMKEEEKLPYKRQFQEAKKTYLIEKSRMDAENRAKREKFKEEKREKKKRKKAAAPAGPGAPKTKRVKRVVPAEAAAAAAAAPVAVIESEKADDEDEGDSEEEDTGDSDR